MRRLRSKRFGATCGSPRSGGKQCNKTKYRSLAGIQKICDLLEINCGSERRADIST